MFDARIQHAFSSIKNRSIIRKYLMRIQQPLVLFASNVCEYNTHKTLANNTTVFDHWKYVLYSRIKNTSGIRKCFVIENECSILIKYLRIDVRFLTIENGYWYHILANGITIFDDWKWVVQSDTCEWYYYFWWWKSIIFAYWKCVLKKILANRSLIFAHCKCILKKIVANKGIIFCSLKMCTKKILANRCLIFAHCKCVLKKILANRGIIFVHWKCVLKKMLANRCLTFWSLKMCTEKILANKGLIFAHCKCILKKILANRVSCFAFWKCVLKKYLRIEVSFLLIPNLFVPTIFANRGLIFAHCKFACTKNICE